jgi:RNA recognition motif-containing protein
LDGIIVGGKHKLIVKISDPERRHARTGALYEGRELHLVNLDWSATEDEVQQAFAKYGKVERVRIPRDLAGKSKGFGFVVFSSKVFGIQDLLMAAF